MIDVLQVLLGVGILGALAGILGVLITQIVTSRRESQARKRERDGLLRILYPEVSMTYRHCHWLKSKYDQDPEEVAKREVAAALATRTQYARTDTWEASRVKLAQHIQSTECGRLASYYRSLRELQEQVDFAGQLNSAPVVQPYTLSVITSFPGIYMLLDTLEDQYQEADKIIRTYVPDVEDPTPAVEVPTQVSEN